MITRIVRDQVLRRLNGLRIGVLTVEDQHGSRRFGGHARSELRAAITIRSSRAWLRLGFGGSLGAAEAYLRGEWVADDLAAALRIFATNLDAVDQLDSAVARGLRIPDRVAHWRRRNSRRGSKRNIRDHYDLGNDFFELFLDDTLTYSCGVFEQPDASLREASIAKLDRVCRRLELSPRDHLLDIGSGWGSLAIHAARRYGCQVTTTTISEAQHDIVRRRVAEAGLADRVTTLCCDYRDLSGTFNRLASIEMVEAVGPQYLPDYFAACSRLLTQDGQMLLQGIVLPEYRYGPYLRSADFIQRYVFPGSALTSVGAMAAAIGQSTDFTIALLEDLSPHYVRTLRCWREQFMSRTADVRRLGRYDERFIRLWEYYLAYCEAGFAERCTGVVQVLLTKPACRRDVTGLSADDRARPEALAVSA
ncbi:MAG: class I SAM-dependent methyltransferase [Acidobacteriota bacterium]